MLCGPVFPFCLMSREHGLSLCSCWSRNRLIPASIVLLQLLAAFARLAEVQVPGVPPLTTHQVRVWGMSRRRQSKKEKKEKKSIVMMVETVTNPVVLMTRRHSHQHCSFGDRRHGHQLCSFDD